MYNGRIRRPEGQTQRTLEHNMCYPGDTDYTSGMPYSAYTQYSGNTNRADTMYYSDHLNSGTQSGGYFDYDPRNSCHQVALGFTDLSVGNAQSNSFHPEGGANTDSQSECVDPALLQLGVDLQPAPSPSPDDQGHDSEAHGTSGDIVLQGYSPANGRRYAVESGNPDTLLARSESIPPWTHLGMSVPDSGQLPQPSYEDSCSSGYYQQSGHSSHSCSRDVRTAPTSDVPGYFDMENSTETLQAAPGPNMTTGGGYNVPGGDFQAELLSGPMYSAPALADRHAQQPEVGSSGRKRLVVVSEHSGPVLMIRSRSYGPSLGVPKPTLARHHSVSTRSSASSVPEVLQCQKDGCNARYSGKYRLGNLQRHRRLDHGVDGKQKEYPCAVSDCPKTYKRQDARLKHYRNYHPELAGPAESRKGSSQNVVRRTGCRDTPIVYANST
jgi:hypothetical protein